MECLCSEVSAKYNGLGKASITSFFDYYKMSFQIALIV